MLRAKLALEDKNFNVGKFYKVYSIIKNITSKSELCSQRILSIKFTFRVAKLLSFTQKPNSITHLIFGIATSNIKLDISLYFYM